MASSFLISYDSNVNDTSEALESFVEAYEGTVILTLHDKYFVERTADIVYRTEEGKA
ncbi:hypothetical protein [Salinicoccus jeotgali]|uniref:ABC transporter ATP-binding protein n=1 Tax=Salinicoccus jeotgali TaxID=381634 RepID=A0ABP7ENM4_9STAP